MEFRILSAAEAGPWREEDVTPAERGVSLHWLDWFVSDRWASVNEPHRLAIEEGKEARAHNEAGKWGLHDMPDKDIPEIPPSYFLNAHGLQKKFILPLTKDIRAPLFALAPPEHRGRPTAFISHTWNSLLMGPERQRIGTFDAVFDRKDAFVWIDFACYNQHTVDNTNISEDMRAIIKAINHVVVAVTPTPLYNRSWCLWELYCADTIGLAPTFSIRSGFRNDKIQAVNALYRSFSGVENARSINDQAEQEIRNAIINRHGGLEKANVAIKEMLKRQLDSKWHELQPDDGPLKFSADPWAEDQQGATLRAYEPYWDPGLMDSLIDGGKETVREVFDRATVYIGAREKASLSVQKSDPANLRLIAALQNEDFPSIMGVVYSAGVDVNQPLPFRGALSYEVAPPLHFLMPWAQLRSIDGLLLAGADINLPWTFPPETKSADATQREEVVRALLNGVGDPYQAAWTPLMLAVQRGDAGICTSLIRAGAKTGFRCPQTGLTALHLAAAAKRKDLVEILTQTGGSIDAALVSGITALHIAAIVGDVDSIRLLLKCGADKSLRDQTGRSAQEWALRCKHPLAVDVFEATTATTFETLKKTFGEKGPALRDAFLNEVLWTVHRNPGRAASLTLYRENPGQYDIEATFDKEAEGVRSTVRVTDNADGQPMQITVTNYSLVGGDWQGKVKENWKRN
jgi:Ankyrin repeats (3 copies)/Ankyrin repeat